MMRCLFVYRDADPKSSCLTCKAIAQHAPQGSSFAYAECIIVLRAVAPS